MGCFWWRQQDQLLVCCRHHIGPTILQGGILHYAKQMTSAASDGAQVLDCVIVAPPFFGPAQRQALYDAAHLAGVLGLLCEESSFIWDLSYVCHL